MNYFFINRNIQMLLAKSNTVNTMSSTQLSEMFRYEKKEVNRKIKDLFASKIDGGIITPSLDSRGYVVDYHLPELESKMFVAKHDISYLEEVTQFWIDNKNKVEEQRKLPSNFIESLAMLMESEKEKEALANEAVRLSKVCNVIASQFKEGLTIPEFCKQLNGVNTQKVNGYLVKSGSLHQVKGGLQPTYKTRDKYIKYTVCDINLADRVVVKRKSTLTKTGCKWLYSQYLKGKLPMKLTWDGSYTHKEGVNL